MVTHNYGGIITPSVLVSVPRRRKSDLSFGLSAVKTETPMRGRSFGDHVSKDDAPIRQDYACNIALFRSILRWALCWRISAIENQQLLSMISPSTFLFSLGYVIRFDTTQLPGSYLPYQKTIVDCIVWVPSQT